MRERRRRFLWLLRFVFVLWGRLDFCWFPGGLIFGGFQEDPA